LILRKKDVSILRELTLDFLNQFFSYIHSSAFSDRYIKHYDTVLDVFQSFCTAEKGDPESSSFSFSIDDIYSLSHAEIKHFTNLYLDNEQNNSKVETLEKIGAFKSLNYFRLGPHLSLFGFIFYRFIQEQFKASSKEDIFSILERLEFNRDLFDNLFTEITDLIVEDVVKLDYFYFIYGVRVTGESTSFDKTKNEEFLKLNNKIRKELIKKFRFRKDEFTGTSILINKMNWIMNCPTMIWGELTVKNPQIKEDLKNLDDLKLKNVDLLVPIYLEEALFLLGYTNPLVHFASITHPSYFGNFSVNSTPRGIFFSRGDFSGLQYPYWMNKEMYDFRRPLGKSEEFVLSSDKLEFLRLYPRFRFKLKENSIERLILNRFYRVMELSDPKDIILESCIIFETITTTETKEVGFQLRIKLAWLLAKNLEYKKLIQKISRILYDIRSDIVHNGGISSEKKAKKLGGLKNAAKISKMMVRILILRILHVGDNKITIMSRNEVSNALDNLMLGEEKQLPENSYFKELSSVFFDNISELVKF